MPYLKDAEGNVYLEADNPRAAWTAQEWEAFKAEKWGEIEMLRRDLEALPKPEPTWPPEAQAMTREFVEVVLGKSRLEIHLKTLMAEYQALENI
jgi:hypothetical protein